MSLITCHKIGKSTGAETLFSELSLTLDENCKLGLIGPNGSGKSTLLGILAGATDVDSGEVSRRRGLRIALVSQREEFPQGLSVEQAGRYLLVQGSPEKESASAPMLEKELSKAGFVDLKVDANHLSGGWRKRLAIAAALASEPDLILFDEPTNHLDFDGLLWLEDLLKSARSPWVLVTHDREFLERTALQMAELNSIYPQGIYLGEGPYSRFVEQRDFWLASESSRLRSMQNKLREEQAWLARSPKARTTKAKYRIDAAGDLDKEVRETSSRLQTLGVDFAFQSSGRETKKLVELEKVSIQRGAKPLFSNLSLILSPGIKIGILGRNGTGKTSFLSLLDGSLEPSQGKLSFAPALSVVHFDQQRESLDENTTLKRALSPHGDTLIYQDKPVHVAAWARRFGFSPRELEAQVSTLSGGEKARALIAQLLLKPADLLLIDEPTNDLDIETIETLEQSLKDFSGALVLVSHDRALLSNVCTHFLALDGHGKALPYASYKQWESTIAKKTAATPNRAKETKGTNQTRSQGKLTYKEKREYDSMEETILGKESEIENLKASISDPTIANNPEKLAEVCLQLDKTQQDIDSLYMRWGELGARA